ncbi:FAD-dependent oxidoreductase [Lichenifustis flavocetrariae]|uniref:FAD-dependent monooxygenase n=1 Tax=Lichenifustis flavocetrariae TaxID=2949735 RepID=A0AA42CKE2_9HYPH|nr:NAD(P)/FAD-dependent oxidoreductase [Lichenifustis flavocetrariae]MCW6510488.1 FAD-dependent monooxygenase [Lichenifustis flavocetrariae]
MLFDQDPQAHVPSSSPGGAGTCRTWNHPEADVAVIGAGLAGSLTALSLSRRGCSVTLIDLHAEPQVEFRAEQLVGPQMSRLAALGVLDAMLDGSAANRSTVNGRRGQVLDRSTVDQFGLPYHRMVSAVRAAMPPTVRVVTAPVANIDTSLDRQTICFKDGSRLEARLVVLATGLSTALPKRMGIGFRTISAAHSMAFGFDVALERPQKQLMPLVYYADDIGKQLDYLALFDMEGTIRANLFGYQDKQSGWIKDFCANPTNELRAALPKLGDLLGPYRVTSAVQLRSNDLRVACEPARAGVVLVGDAFQTPCPAAGTGIDRLLSDVMTLSRHAPSWLASPGMSADKIAAYYADPDKLSVDAECLRIADYRRAVSTEPGVAWAFHRKQVLVRRRLRAAWASLSSAKMAANALAVASLS